MGEAVLTRRSVVKNEYQKLADITVSGSAVTQVDITGLNLVKGEEYVLVFEIINPTASVPSFRLFANSNYTDTNYYSQTLQVDNTTIGASRVNIASLGYAQPNNKLFGIAKIKLTNKGYFVFQVDGNYDVGLSTFYLATRHTTSTFTMTSITSLRIFSVVASSIGIGSRFQLYRSGGV